MPPTTTTPGPSSCRSGRTTGMRAVGRSSPRSTSAGFAPYSDVDSVQVAAALIQALTEALADGQTPQSCALHRGNDQTEALVRRTFTAALAAASAGALVLTAAL